MKILILGGGKLNLKTIEIFQKHNFDVYVADKSDNAPAFKLIDINNSINIDIIDHESIYNCVNEKKINIVFPINDAGMFTAAYCNEKLNLNTVNTKNVLGVTDKGRMRDLWKQNNINQPDYKVITSVDKEFILNEIKTFGFPCVVKPCLFWGSKGVFKLESSNNLENEIDELLKFNRNDRFIVEKFINGVECTIEGIIFNESIEILSISEKKHLDSKKFLVAMELLYPASFNNDVKESIIKTVKQAAKALNLNNCPIHCEVFVSDRNEIFLVEMAARPGGGHILHTIVQEQSGVEYPIAILNAMLELQFNYKKTLDKGVIYKFFSPPIGIFKRIKNLDEIKELEYVKDIGITLKDGDEVKQITGDAERSGYLVCTGENANIARKNATYVLNKIEFEMYDY